jgi:ectoine hydroxylase-related dioxygenase (phytanoyl-CoA dioxygenase family)
MNTTTVPAFSDEQRYLFDLQGYVVLRQVVSEAVIARANRAMARLEALGDGELPPRVVLGAPRTPSNLYISNILEAGDEFDDFIDVPAVLAAIAGVVGVHHRLNHAYSITRHATGFTALHMGGTPLVAQAPYAVIGGSIYSPLTKAVFPLLPCRPEDGCFAAISGSHKSAFPRPWGTHPQENPPLVPVAAEPGDAIVFSEAMTHGSMVNVSGRLRRTLYFCYSQSWTADWTRQGLNHSEDLLNRLPPERRALLQLNGGSGGLPAPMRYAH